MENKLTTNCRVLVQTNVGIGALILSHKLKVYISSVELDHSNSAKLSISDDNSINTAVRNMWVFTIKQKPDYSFDRYKVQLVV